MEYTGDGVAIRLFGLEIRWYAVMIVTGMIIAIYLAGKEAKRRGFDEEVIYDLAMIILPISVLGARIWYVLFEWERYQGDFLAMINIRQGGLAIQGGIMAGLVTGYFFCKRKNLPFLTLADILFPVVALAQGIGRWGNFFNNEAYGVATDLPWALIIDGQKVHPTFLYESIGDILLFFFLRYYSKNHAKADGQVAMLYFVFYGILRFFVEGLRTDSLYWGEYRVAQILSILGVIIGLVGYYLLSKKKMNKQKV